MKRERHIGRFLLALAVACSVGLYAGHSLGETVKAQEDAQVHIVDQGETLWEICSKVNNGREDVWEVIDRTRLDNDIKDPGALKPGQVITIRVKK